MKLDKLGEVSFRRLKLGELGENVLLNVEVEYVR